MPIGGPVSTIRRGERPADRFTIISNEFHRDKRLSFAARGLGGYLMSHVEGWEISASAIARDNGIGRDQVRGLLQELERFGYLRRTRLRGEGGKLGSMVHEIQCTPWTGQVPEKPRSNQRLADQALVDQGLAGRPHKKTASKKTTPEEEQDPSGGAPGGAAVDHVEAEMTKPDPAQAALFEAPKPPKRPASADDPSARTVVAAYVDSHRRHQGGDPLRRDIGRVARDAKALLDRGEASPHELEAAAREMGQSTWSNIAMALKIRRRREQPSATGATQPIPYGSDRWERLEAEQLEAAASRPVSAELQAMRDRYTSSAVAGVA